MPTLPRRGDPHAQRNDCPQRRGARADPGERAEACRAAREELGLHRIEAGTLLDDHASPRVLAKGGFTRIGTAPGFLHIDGAWRDHPLFQRLPHDDPPPA